MYSLPTKTIRIIDNIAKCELFAEHWDYVLLPFIVSNTEPTYEFAFSAVTVWIEQAKRKSKRPATTQANQSGWDHADKLAQGKAQGWASPAEAPKWNKGDCHAYFEKEIAAHQIAVTTTLTPNYQEEKAENEARPQGKRRK